MKNLLDTLPPELQTHVERAQRGLTNGASGPQRIEGAASLEALVRGTWMATVSDVRRDVVVSADGSTLHEAIDNALALWSAK